MSDAQERTENATEKRMKDVRSKGKLQKSQDVTAWLGVGAAAVMLPATITAGTAAATHQMFAIGQVAARPQTGTALELLGEGLSTIVPTMSLMLAAVVVAVFVGSAAQGGIHPKKLAGKFEQFDPVKGIKRVFGTQALWQGVKTLAKTAVVGLVLYAVIQGLMPVLMTSGGLSITAVIAAASEGATALMIAAVAAGLLLAAADVFVVMKRNRKQTRMTKKEVTDENKNSDGDPLIKSQRRSRQLAMSRNRMIASVATADVVIVNPTHVAVALKYEPGKSAPRIVAKGSGHNATRIREEATAENVPMVSDIPLARALHAACDVGTEIPVEFYNAVARVLTFVAALTRRGASSGIHTMTQPALTPGGN
ncbi:EscU/YscU/HrcU family type III secretion system export apparatus switch protein [Glaciibacter psychrotolerans]|uniref:Flagellar biosynthetic protein FlhB n=1 Tax=Glaciibacter psychrotolerans TaxID=670054 RepID=A0A7Z0EBV0_9MICO|nr:EscU/YscU/HrcU family type III secretion system export apparatus switch protein [Leifsonia psychrotolerans]NYJ18776.1 flagellar biosynthetic protein FlhB [Leifsonia psychrotolerans]